MSQLIRRLSYFFHRRQRDRELATDMDFHQEMAAREGRVNFGSTLRLREEAREAWGWTWMDRLSQDLKYALRNYRKSPAFTLGALLMLAIGIGTNVAVFGFFNLMVLRPINVQDPGTLVRFHRRSLNQYAYAVPVPEMAFFREHSRTLSAVIGVNSTGVSFENEDQPVEADFVTANFFRELGGYSHLGRTLDPALDERQSAPPVIVLSAGTWERHFGSDHSVVGRVVRINGKPATVVGVARRDFSGVGSGMKEPAFWSPLAQQPYFVNGSRLLTDTSMQSAGVSLWGRLRPGVDPKIAEEELRSLAAQLRSQYPINIWENERLLSQPGGYLTSMLVGNRRGTGPEQQDPVYPIFALVGTLTAMILAVACANLGNMLLARGVARQREMGIRISVGAGAGRLIRQLFTESLLLALLGSGAALIFGLLVLRALLLSTGAPIWMNAFPDWRVCTFALGAGIASALLFGLTPALQIGRQRRRAHRTRYILIGSQIAASCILVIVTGLLVRALYHETSRSPGFDYEHVISLSPGLSRNGYTPLRSQAYLNTLEERMRALPGVQSVALALSPPLGHVSITAGTDLNGQHLDFEVNHVSPEFFSTMGIALLRGRTLQPNERHVVIVSESMARLAWPGQDPLGKTLPLDESRSVVVGISGNVHSVSVGSSDTVQAYFPIEQDQRPSLSMLVKTAGSAGDLARFAFTTAKDVDPMVSPAVEMLSHTYRANLQGAEYSALAVGSLGLIAQILACFGIIGTVSYAVSQRTKEIGIRMALGAKPSQVLSAVLRHLFLPVLLGLVVGVLGGVGLAQFLRGRLYGISYLDPAAYGGALLLFALTLTMAAILPARRALRIDPLRALRYE